MRSLSFVLALLIVGTSSFDASSLSAQRKPRENDLKLPIGGTPGALNAITDVAGVEVGHSTIISGSGALVVGQGPVRTGVTRCGHGRCAQRARGRGGAGRLFIRLPYS